MLMKQAKYIKQLDGTYKCVKCAKTIQAREGFAPHSAWHRKNSLKIENVKQQTLIQIQHEIKRFKDYAGNGKWFFRANCSCRKVIQGFTIEQVEEKITKHLQETS